MKKLPMLALAVAMLVSSSYGLEAKDGRMRLVVDERSGRFSLHYLSDVATNRYVPLLYAQEIRTTYPTLMVDQKTYRLGDTSEFRVTVGKYEAGAVKVEYRSAFCAVRQTFTFVASKGAAMADSVRIGFEIENLSQNDSKIGLRFLLDTWLGEKSLAHFGSASSGALTGETELGSDYSDSWIRSAENLGTAISTEAPLSEMADLIAVRAILDALNDALATGTPLSADDQAALNATLERLETRKGKY
jgi:hypothetical protein